MVGTQKLKVTDNDTFHYCAPPAQEIHTHFLWAQLKAAHLTDRCGRLRGKATCPRSHSQLVAGPGIKRKVQSACDTPQRRLLPAQLLPHQLHFLQQGGDQRPSPRVLAREILGSSFLSPPTQATGSRPSVWVHSPRRALQATGHPPLTLNFHLKIKMMKIKGKEEVLLKRRRVVTPGGSLETNGDFVHPL